MEDTPIEQPNVQPPVIPPEPGTTTDELYAVIENPEGKTIQFEEIPLDHEPSEDEVNVAAYYISRGENPDGVGPGTDVENYENGAAWLRKAPLEWRVNVISD